MSPGRVDVEALRRRLLALDEALTELGRHVGRGEEVLREDLSERWSVERGLQIAVQSVLDTVLNEHLGELREFAAEIEIYLRS